MSFTSKNERKENNLNVSDDRTSNIDCQPLEYTCTHRGLRSLRNSHVYVYECVMYVYLSTCVCMCVCGGGNF